MVKYACELHYPYNVSSHGIICYPYCLPTACPNGHPYAIGDVSNLSKIYSLPTYVSMNGVLLC